MSRIVSLPQILQVLEKLDLVAAMESAFVAYSEGLAVVPPIGELLFDRPRGEVHIKYGYVKAKEHFVIKVASGFYDNPQAGLPPFGGVVLLFSQRTGLLDQILLDEGHLTNHRTAAAGATAAKHLANSNVSTIGVLGTGTQARLQVQALKPLFATREMVLWGRRIAAAEACAADLRRSGFTVTVLATPRDVAQASDLIVTTTSSSVPLLNVNDVRPGTHITAMGSDAHHKQELSAQLVARADVVVADSRVQCLSRGEIHHAVATGCLDPKTVIELGEVIAGRTPGRRRPSDITIADLTGVAVQDIAIAEEVLRALQLTSSADS